jgi:hypothetical protein
VDRLADQDAEAPPEDLEVLPGPAHQMVLDAMELGVVTRLVAERSRLEIAFELAIDPRQQVAVQRCVQAVGRSMHASSSVGSGVESTPTTSSASLPSVWPMRSSSVAAASGA